jgi:hypothetical protein
MMKKTIEAKGTEIAIISRNNGDDYISLTDIAKYKNKDDAFIVINNWMRLRDTIEFLGLWESLSNPEFKPIEFDRFRQESGYNAFTLSPQKWIKATNAVGIISKSGRYGGTFAHKDIAFEFASWISAEFKLYVIKDYQRLKESETSQKALDWNLSRAISKINYKIHTDAIKENLIPHIVSKKQQTFTYASEADILNVAMFGITAKEWKEQHPDAIGNIRDSATIQQLIVLSNMESMNAELIKQGITQDQRLSMLNKMAIDQMTSILGSATTKKLQQ